MGESPNSVTFDSGPGPVILLGLGFTTRRLAPRLRFRGLTVFAVARQISRFAQLAELGVQIVQFDTSSPGILPSQATIIHTIPPLPPDENLTLRAHIRALNPRRVIYISSTSVYGEQLFVDHNNTAAPSEEKGYRRVEEEEWLARESWSSLVIRPAAIYGPGRGIHVRVRDGRAQRASGAAVVSRIHVDDLVTLLEAGIYSSLEGAWPAADNQPCSTDEITDWCSSLMGTRPQPGREKRGRIAGRTVRGHAIRELLGVRQKYPAFPEGILASLAEAP